MTKSVAKHEPTHLAPVTPDSQSGGEILSQSIVIPRLLLMQGLSQLVQDGKAVAGDIVRSTTTAKIGGVDKALHLVPICFTNTWRLEEKVGLKYEFRRNEPLTAKNQDLPWDFKENGLDWKRKKTLNLFALLVDDIRAEQTELAKAAKGEMPDPEKALMPVLISFRSTSYNAGKDVMTHFAKAEKFRMPGHVSTLELGCSRTKNDKGQFLVFTVKGAGMTPKEYLGVAEYWKKILSTSTVQVDSEDAEDEGGLGEASQF